jgi:hypothetical protein
MNDTIEKIILKDVGIVLYYRNGKKLFITNTVLSVMLLKHSEIKEKKRMLTLEFNLRVIQSKATGKLIKFMPCEINKYVENIRSLK